MISFCDRGDKYVAFLALGWYKWPRNMLSFSASIANRAKKLPGFLLEEMSPLKVTPREKECLGLFAEEYVYSPLSLPGVQYW